MIKKYKTPILIVLGLAVLFFLMYLPTLNDPNRDLINSWNDADIGCLNGHQDVAIHYHPNLTVTIDGEDQRIPADTGIVSSCMAEVHTHDSSGRLHVESSNPGKDITLGQFFEVWSKDLNKEGYNLTATLNGEEIENPGDLVLQDGDNISLNYQSTEENSTSTESSPDA